MTKAEPAFPLRQRDSAASAEDRCGAASDECPKYDCSFVVSVKVNEIDNGWSRRRGIGQ